MEMKRMETNDDFDLSQYHPECCTEHRTVLRRKHLLDTSRWQFPEADSELDIDSKHLSPSAVRKLEAAKRVNEQLEEIRLQDFSNMIKSCLKPETATNVAHVLKISLETEKAESRKVQKPTSEEDILKSSDRIISDEVPDSNYGLGEDDSDTDENIYLNLLECMEKSEREKKKSDSEKLAYKLVEQKLDETAEEFCNWVSDLLKEEDESDSRQIKIKDTVIKPKKVRDLFRNELTQSRLCPFVPVTVQEAKDRLKHPAVTQKIKKPAPTVQKVKPKWKISYFTPPSQWFDTCHKVDTFYLTNQEEDMMKSFGYQKFMQYLGEKGEPVPRIFVDMKERYREKIRRAKQMSNENK